MVLEITMKMNSLGAKTWKNLTADNIGHSIAIVLDNYVYSFQMLMEKLQVVFQASKEILQLRKQN